MLFGIRTRSTQPRFRILGGPGFCSTSPASNNSVWITAWQRKGEARPIQDIFVQFSNYTTPKPMLTAEYGGTYPGRTGASATKYVSGHLTECACVRARVQNRLIGRLQVDFPKFPVSLAISHTYCTYQCMQPHPLAVMQ